MSEVPLVNNVKTEELFHDWEMVKKRQSVSD